MAYQVARLFARGSLLNVTGRNLTAGQKLQVDALFYEVWKDPEIQSQKHRFCMILANTIRGEYHRPNKYVRDWRDLGAQMCELSFAFWRACVDVLFHNPKPDVVNSRIARLKYFKTHMFNYARQILNENKIPMHKEQKQHTALPHVLAKRMVESIFQAETKDIQFDLEEDDYLIIFHINTLVMAEKLVRKIRAVRDRMVNYGVLVEIFEDSIWITRHRTTNSEVTRTITETTKLKFISDAHTRQSGEDDGFGKFVEGLAQKRSLGQAPDGQPNQTQYRFSEKERQILEPVVYSDAFETLMGRLTPNGRAVLNILLHQPKDFTDRYFKNRKKEVTSDAIKDSQLADYLGLTKDEVKEIRTNIKQQAEALDIKPAQAEAEVAAL